MLTHPEPQALFDSHALTGKQVGSVPVGLPGSKERVDFGAVIGYFVDTAGAAPTTIGIIHYADRERAHIVPARPGKEVAR